MYIDIYIPSTKRKNVGEWIRMPTYPKVIDDALEEICTDSNDNCVVTKFKTKFNLNDLDIVGTEDIYYLNELISKLSNCATNKEIVALAEVYSNNLEEILLKVYRGNYKFYPNKSLDDVAQIFSKRKYYRYYDNEEIIDDLTKMGYEETSTGVIQIY